MKPNQFDFVILGSGRTAFAAALHAQELGKSSVMIEERTSGGTCVDRGCPPSKNLIEAAKLIHDAHHPRYPGLKPAVIDLDFRQIIEQKDDIVHAYRKREYESLAGGLFAIETGHAEFVDNHTVQVVGKCELTGEKILIATGSRPLIPEIEGIREVPFLTSDLLANDGHMEMRELPHSLVVLGGGYIALELGQMLRRFGVEVTIVERSERLLARGYEPEVGEAIGKIFRNEGINVITNAFVSSVRQEGKEVVVGTRASGGVRELRAERLLIATGRVPNSNQIAIEKAGVEVGKNGPVLVDEFLHTNVLNIFAAGDVIGGELGSQMATPVASKDGSVAAHNAFTSEVRRVDHRVIPRTIFTDPQVATVGMTEAEAIAAGHDCWCNTVPIWLVPRAGVIRETSGIIKMVANVNTEEVLGVSIVGNSAGEVIHEAAMGLRFRAKIHDFVELLHVYPTMAEALKIVAISRWKDPAKLSCCYAD
jgi:mercuric reductase